MTFFIKILTHHQYLKSGSHIRRETSGGPVSAPSMRIFHNSDFRLEESRLEIASVLLHFTLRGSSVSRRYLHSAFAFTVLFSGLPKGIISIYHSPCYREFIKSNRFTIINFFSCSCISRRKIDFFPPVFVGIFQNEIFQSNS